jgi:hypothetical protein
VSLLVEPSPGAQYLNLSKFLFLFIDNFFFFAYIFLRFGSRNVNVFPQIGQLPSSSSGGQRGFSSPSPPATLNANTFVACFSNLLLLIFLCCRLYKNIDNLTEEGITQGVALGMLLCFKFVFYNVSSFYFLTKGYISPSRVVSHTSAASAPADDGVRYVPAHSFASGVMGSYLTNPRGTHFSVANPTARFRFCELVFVKHFLVSCAALRLQMISLWLPLIISGTGILGKTRYQT